jgi:hypothetical protein
MGAPFGVTILVIESLKYWNEIQVFVGNIRKYFQSNSS